MAWTLTEPLSGVTVTLTPLEGDIEVVEEQETAVLYARRGSSPWVADGPRRIASISVPDLVFTDTTKFEMLRLLRSMSRRLILTDDTGTGWPVRFVGGITWKVLDLPDRATHPMRHVTVRFVGVA